MADTPLQDIVAIEKLAHNPTALERHVSQAVETGMAVITTYGLKMIGAIIILVIGWTVAGFVRSAVIKAGKRSAHVDETVFTFLASLAKYAVLIFTLVAMLASFGVETTSFVAVLGAAGIAIGLALQGTLSHVASGFMLIMFRPFRLGDEVEAAGITGIVTDISLFTTEFLRADNVVIVVPNSAIWSGNIKNFTSHAERKLSVEVAVAYSAKLDDAIGALRELIAADARIHQTPAPLVAVSRLADTGVVLLVEVWVTGKDLAAVRYDLNKRIKMAFDTKGIAMPTKQVYLTAGTSAG